MSRIKAGLLHAAGRVRPDPYWTHVPTLVKHCLAHKPHTIVECGTGYYSTPVLHAIAQQTGAKLLSMESNPRWLVQFTHMATDYHSFQLVNDWQHEFPTGDLVFVDSGPVASRRLLLSHITAPVILVHDATVPAYDIGYRTGYERSVDGDTVVFTRHQP